jgi:tetratricopeptide (TPR) repeat protein
VKHFIIFLFALFNANFLQSNPLLVAVLMVKNEEPVMHMTLQPLVDAGIKDFLIYDTGSTDNTIDVTKQFFIENNISNFVIEQAKWVDFSTCRNRALELTEQYFPDATFMLMLDAEWLLCNGAALLDFCEDQQDETPTLYLIKLLNQDLDFYHARLIRCRSGIQFCGKVHEVPTIPAQALVPDFIYFQLNFTHYGQEKTAQRWMRDIEFLTQELENSPNNPRILYYLAQTYYSLKDWDNAIATFQERIAINGDAEENYLALMGLGMAYAMNNDAKNMIATFLKAFEVRPCRAEPLIRLAMAFSALRCPDVAYVFAKYAVTMQYPAHDLCCIEKNLYDFVRYDLISCLAMTQNEFMLGKQATLKALQAKPELQYLQENLKQYKALLSQKYG